MMKKILPTLLFSAGIVGTATACTGISLTTEGNDHIQARTIEWGESNLNSKLVISPRNYQFTSTMPDQQKGLTWTSKYGFTGISVSVDTFIGEGVNEAGLTAGLFYFKGYGSLKSYNPKERENSVTDLDLVRWMLSQFKTVDEVKEAIKKIDIVPVYIDAKGKPSPTGHWRVTDKQGNNIVIEIVDGGKIHVYDNDVGVLTNSPTFPWQVTNLNNYVNLHAGTSGPTKFGDLEAKSFGTGTAFLGLPGDISPPSRFVRAAFFVKTAPEFKTSTQAVSEAFHILNNFDIPIGTEFAPQDRSHMPDLPSATQWTSVIDQNHGYLYYNTMNDSQIKKVDLNKIDFTVKGEQYKKLDNGSFNFKDVAL